jgi:integrase
MRIPKQIKIAKKIEGTHIRRSTKTRDRLKALALARRWWVEVMEKNKDGGLLPYEIEGQRDDDLYSRGRFLNAGLDKLDPQDGNEVEEFISRNFGKGKYSFNSDVEALYHYQDSQLERDVEINAQSLLSSGLKLTDRGKYLNELIERHVKDATKKVTDKTREKYLGHLMLFLEMVGNKPIADLTYDDIVDDFINKLPLLPSNINSNKKFVDSSGQRLSIEEIVSLAKKEELECLSANTQYDKISRVKTFLLWCKKLKHIDESLLTAFDYISKPEKKNTTERLPFTNSEIEKIFYNDVYQTSACFRELTFRYWGPLLAYYTGARLGEICQIHLKDIKYSEDGRCWFISLLECDEQHRRLKTESSARDVPIHNDLITLGFVKYKKYLQNQGEVKLFPDLNPDANEAWGRKLGRWFNADHLKDCSVKVLPKHKNSKVFHCFRHTIVNEAKQQLLNERIIKEIVGHAHSNGETSTYQKDFPIAIKHKELKKLKFSLDVSKLKPWE